MALFTVKTSKKIDTNIRLEESTAKMLDRYAHFHKSPADDVVNEALEYIFTKDKDFQQDLTRNPDVQVEGTLRVKKSPASPSSSKNASKATATAAK
jgi:hypothetical protein